MQLADRSKEYGSSKIAKENHKAKGKEETEQEGFICQETRREKTNGESWLARRSRVGESGDDDQGGRSDGVLRLFRPRWPPILRRWSHQKLLRQDQKLHLHAPWKVLRRFAHILATKYRSPSGFRLYRSCDVCVHLRFFPGSMPSNSVGRDDESQWALV